jgi:protein-disulfide isomerase
MRLNALRTLSGSRPAALDEQTVLTKEKPMSRLRVPVTPDDHIAGKDDAPATLVEYGDYECPACGAAHPVVNRLRQHFGDELRFVFRHFPLNEIHPNAETAAETAEFAGAHDRFWQMHEAIYDNQGHLGPPLLIAIAAQLRLPVADLEDALANGKYAPTVRSHFVGGVRSGVNATPTFFINNVRHDADFGFNTLARAITDAIIENETRLRTAS